MGLFTRLIIEEEGQGLVEYTLLIGVLVLTLWASVTYSGVVSSVTSGRDSCFPSIPGSLHRTCRRFRSVGAADPQLARFTCHDRGNPVKCLEGDAATCRECLRAGVRSGDIHNSLCSRMAGCWRCQAAGGGGSCPRGTTTPARHFLLGYSGRGIFADCHCSEEDAPAGSARDLARYAAPDLEPGGGASGDDQRTKSKRGRHNSVWCCHRVRDVGGFLCRPPRGLGGILTRKDTSYAKQAQDRCSRCCLFWHDRSLRHLQLFAPAAAGAGERLYRPALFLPLNK